MACQALNSARLSTGLALVVLLLPLGCRPSQEAPPSLKACSHFNLHGYELTSKSSPSEVAEAVLAAVDANDVTSLNRLVAAKRVFADVQKLIHDNQAFRRSADNAPQITADVVLARLSTLESGSRSVGREVIRKNTATVDILGIRDGMIEERRLYFVREDDLWRLVPSMQRTGIRE